MAAVSADGTSAQMVTEDGDDSPSRVQVRQRPLTQTEMTIGGICLMMLPIFVIYSIVIRDLVGVPKKCLGGNFDPYQKWTHYGMWISCMGTIFAFMMNGFALIRYEMNPFESPRRRMQQSEVSSVVLMCAVVFMVAFNDGCFYRDMLVSYWWTFYMIGFIELILCPCLILTTLDRVVKPRSANRQKMALWSLLFGSILPIVLQYDILPMLMNPTIPRGLLFVYTLLVYAISARSAFSDFYTSVETARRAVDRAENSAAAADTNAKSQTKPTKKSTVRKRRRKEG